MASIKARKNLDGSISFQAVVRLKGLPRPIYATFSRKSDVRRWVQQTEAAIREGRYFKHTEARRHTVAELVDRYLRDSLPNRRSKQTPLQTLTWWKERIGHLTLDEVNASVIREYWDSLSSSTHSTRTNRPLRPRTLNGYLETLAAAFSVAVREYCWTSTNPVADIKRKPLRNSRERYLTDIELKLLLQAVEKSPNSYLHPAVLLALSTGARYSEIMTLRWPDVDLEKRRVTFRITKNGLQRVVPLNTVAADALTKHGRVRRLDSDYLFPARRFRWKGKVAKNSLPYEDLRPPFERALLAAGISDFRWHDLRHQCASLLLAEGASLTEVGKILGHKTPQMTWRYSHLMMDKTTELVCKLDERLKGYA